MEGALSKRGPTLHTKSMLNWRSAIRWSPRFMKNSLPIKTHAKVRRALRGLKEEPLNEMEDGHIFGGRYHM